MSSEINFVRILFPMIVGIVFSNQFSSLYLRDIFTSALIIISILLSLVSIFYARYQLYTIPAVNSISIPLLFFFFGGTIQLWNCNILSSKHFSIHTFSYAKFRVSSEPIITGKQVRFIADVLAFRSGRKWQPSLGSAAVALQLNEPVDISYGDEMISTGHFSDTEPPLNPGMFSYKKWLGQQNVHHQTMYLPHEFKLTGHNTGNQIIRAGYRIRKNLIMKYRLLIKDQAAFAIASTLILGYRSDLSSETRDAFAKTGTVHALSVSGAHVAIVYLLIDNLLYFLNRQRKLQLTKLAIILIGLWSYALLTSFSPAVLRASIMLSIFLFAKNFFRDINRYNVLAFSAWCLLTYQPSMFFDVGFQLSFVAVFGLLYLQPIIFGFFTPENKYVDKLWGFIAMCIAAQLATFPLSVFYFHQFPLYFLVGNVFIIIPVNLIMGFGIFILIPGLEWLAPIAEISIIAMNRGLHCVADWPWSTINGIYFSTAELLLLCCSLIAICIAIELKSSKFLLSGMILSLLFCLSLSIDKIFYLKQRKILFYSLSGKSYATAFIWGDSALVVTNLKKTEDRFQFQVKPSLEKFKVNTTAIYKPDNAVIFGQIEMNNFQIKFGQHTILLYNHILSQKKIAEPVMFDMVWIYNTQSVNFQELNNKFFSKLLIIDGSISKRLDSQIRQETDNIRRNTYYLKKNPAYLLEIN